MSGLSVGALGRLALPGPDPMSLFQTTLIGIAGSFAAGLLSLLVLGRHGGASSSPSCYQRLSST